MSALNYKTRDNSNPKGKPRVYFCCHPDDRRYFADISFEILALQNCAIWYLDDSAEDIGDSFLEDLKQMQLFVMPITSKLLNTNNHAIDVEFKFAVENNIPVLPLIQEEGLEEKFNQKCGEIQFLNKKDADPTAISYTEKLKKYLQSILVDDELAEKIRSAFDAYVFLSYRKKDRKYAQELMRLIHKNDFCRDIAIWYDEFLTPGENFNDSIKEALQKSGLFVLTVTPNLVNENNYIMTTEYPAAVEENKPILAVEMLPTDSGELVKNYKNIPDTINPYSKEISSALLSSLKEMAIKENDRSPEHTFFIGLAYLDGIDVEIDSERAVTLITKAADAGLFEAMDKLYHMYMYGKGVKRDIKKAIKLKRKHLRLCKKLYFKTGNVAYADYYFNNINIPVDYWNDRKKFFKSICFDLSCIWFYTKKVDGKVPGFDSLTFSCLLNETLFKTSLARGNYGAAQRAIADLVTDLKRLMELDTDKEHLGRHIYKQFIYQREFAYLEHRLSRYDSAKELFLSNMEMVKRTANTAKIDENAWGWLSVAYHDLANCCLAMKDKEGYKEYSEKTLASLRAAEESGCPLWETSASNKGIVLLELGDALCEEGDLEGALKNYDEASTIFLRLAKETNDDEMHYQLSVAYDRMADIELAKGENIRWAKKLYYEVFMIRSNIQKTYKKDCYPDVAELKWLIADIKDVDAERLEKVVRKILNLRDKYPKERIYNDAINLFAQRAQGQTHN